MERDAGNVVIEGGGERKGSSMMWTGAASAKKKCDGRRFLRETTWNELFSLKRSTTFQAPDAHAANPRKGISLLCADNAKVSHSRASCRGMLVIIGFADA